MVSASLGSACFCGVWERATMGQDLDGESLEFKGTTLERNKLKDDEM